MPTDPSDDPRDRRRGDYPVSRPAQLRWGDVDIYGHVNNAAYYYLMDTAINGWLIEQTGTDIRRLPAIGVVVETGCRYLREVQFPSPLDLGIRLDGTGRSSVRYEVGFFIAAKPRSSEGRAASSAAAQSGTAAKPRSSEGRAASSAAAQSGIDDAGPAAVARFVHVYIDRDTRRPVDIPGEIRRALDVLRGT